MKTKEIKPCYEIGSDVYFVDNHNNTYKEIMVGVIISVIVEVPENTLIFNVKGILGDNVQLLLSEMYSSYILALNSILQEKK